MLKESVRDLRVEQFLVGELKPDARNARKHSDLQVGQIARSIEAFGFNVPLLIDAQNVVMAGHGRLLAARKLGWKVVPVIRLNHLNATQARAFAIADNRLTENSTWDDRLLGEVFRDLATLDVDFSLEVTGFSMGEIDLRIEALETPVTTEPDPADLLPAVPEQPATTRVGDIWLANKHRILCGDATDPECFLKLMQQARAHVVFCDAPYNLQVDGHVSGNGRIHHREFAMAAGEMTSSQFTYFLATVFQLLARFSVRGSIHFHCMDWRHQLEILTAGNQVYSELKNLCVWVKNNAGMGSQYRSQHELIFVFKHGKSAHRNNIQLGRNGRYRTNVWNYPSVSSFGRSGEEGNLLALHPTVKPVALVADAILDCSSRGDIVLDAFLGSGSTVIAAERTGRVCHGIEIDPLYVDTAIRRWQLHTGGQAIHSETGMTFEDMAVQRREESHG